MLWGTGYIPECGQNNQLNRPGSYPKGEFDRVHTLGSAGTYSSMAKQPGLALG